MNIKDKLITICVVAKTEDCVPRELLKKVLYPPLTLKSDCKIECENLSLTNKCKG